MRALPVQEVAIDDLRLLPEDANPRRATKTSDRLLEASLQLSGLHRAITVDDDLTVLAGNHTARKAGEVGVAKRVLVIDVDGETLIAVRRRGLTLKQKVELGLRDNRAAETPAYDPTVLHLVAGQAGVDLPDVFGDDRALAKLAAQADQAAPSGNEPADVFGVIVPCDDRDHQQQTLTELQGRGYAGAKVLTP